MPRWLPNVFLAFLWTGLAASGRLDGFALSASFAMFVAFPLSLHLDDDVPAWLRAMPVVVALPTAASFFVGRGEGAAALGGCWALATVPHAVYGFVRFLSNPAPSRPHAWAEAAGAVGPLVSTVALVTSRYGATFAGFPEPLATLTVTHFHFTFGLLPLTLSALARGGFAARRPLWALVFVPPLLGVMFATRAVPLLPAIGEAAVATVLALAAAAWAVASWRPLGSLPATEAWCSRLAAVGFAGALALPPVFAGSAALGVPLLDFGDMLRAHGLTLAVAITTLGVAAARGARFSGVTGTLPAPDLTAATRDVEPERALFRDRREADLGPSAGGRFERLADALLDYHFYPDDVMVSTSTFKAARRPATVGDRIGMVLLVPLVPGMPAVRFPATTEVNLAARGPDHAAFGYLTTTAHYGRGAWSATLREDQGRVLLTLESRMTPTHPLALLGLPLYRWFQKRAHRAGIARLAATP